MSDAGTVYLIHLERPLQHARHYLGWTGRPIEERLQDHRAGRGSAMLAAAGALGIGFAIVRTWPGGRTEERRLKRCRSAAKFCPTCRADPEREKRPPWGGPYDV